MTRKQFDQLVADALASLPPKYRSLLDNVAVLVEDLPAAQGPPEDVADDEDLLMGEFIGVPRTSRALWDMPPEPARVLLYQKNIEAFAADAAADDSHGPSLDEIIREEVRLTVLHELGHFFGMEEDQLEDV
ncbi:MAG: metallopeptidase family protein [Acidobacteria bacterium]|nr:metallopeptidase family protein [Acidobacteriota bacterium]